MSAARKYLATKIGQRKLQPTLYFTMNCLLLTKAEGTPQNGDPLPRKTWTLLDRAPRSARSAGSASGRPDAPLSTL